MNLGAKPLASGREPERELASTCESERVRERERVCELACA